jgi:hypothetical protein
MPALQAWNLEFKPQTYQKKNKRSICIFVYIYLLGISRARNFALWIYVIWVFSAWALLKWVAEKSSKFGKTSSDIYDGHLSRSVRLEADGKGLCSERVWASEAVNYAHTLCRGCCSNLEVQCFHDHCCGNWHSTCMLLAF